MTEFLCNRVLGASIPSPAVESHALRLFPYLQFRTLSETVEFDDLHSEGRPTGFGRFLQGAGDRTGKGTVYHEKVEYRTQKNKQVKQFVKSEYPRFYHRFFEGVDESADGKGHAS